ncbi:MAG: hypothetical protein HY907_20475 [Deltaproteobacteria bacterium]|nr:hypothetical protein [Deltaproteobacteria bacterium]
MFVLADAPPPDAEWFRLMAPAGFERVGTVGVPGAAGPDIVQFDLVALDAIAGFHAFWPWDVATVAVDVKVVLSNEVLVYLDFRINEPRCRQFSESRSGDEGASHAGCPESVDRGTANLPAAHDSAERNDAGGSVGSTPTVLGDVGS